MPAEIQYADSGGVYIAYQAFGAGPRDVLVVMEGFIPIDTMDDEPRLAHAMRRLGSFARVIRFDRRGIGLSDPVSPHAPPTLEQWVEDAIAALDANASTSATVIASSDASPVALLMAAAHPDRVDGLVIVNGFARVLVDVDYREGLDAETFASVLDMTNPSPDDDVDMIAQYVPSAAHDQHFRQWWIETGHRGASPATARALLRVALEADVRAVLPTIRAPTLVAYLQHAPTAVGSQYLGDHIEHATVVVAAGSDDFWWASDSAGRIIDEIEEFVTGTRAGRHPDRRLATLLFTDIVDSTKTTGAVGDAAWRQTLDRHDALVRRQLRRFRGTEINTTGDGFLVAFDGPTRAVECACVIRDAAEQLGIKVRCGVHTGEVEARGDDVTGLAVDIAARVAALADPGAVLVSRTVADLVVGSGLDLTEHGTHDLKGVPGSWQVFLVGT